MKKQAPQQKKEESQPFEVHMGEIVSGLLEEKRMKRNALIDYLKTNKSNISRLLEKPDWRLSEVAAVSHALRLNLFKYVVNDSNIKGEVLTETPLYRNEKLQKEITEITTKYEQEKKLRQALEENNIFYKEKVRGLEMKLNSKKKS